MDPLATSRLFRMACSTLDPANRQGHRLGGVSRAWSDEDRQGLVMHVHAGPPVPEHYVSCFWALVRDARIVAKRDPETGVPTYEEVHRPQEAHILYPS